MQTGTEKNERIRGESTSAKRFSSTILLDGKSYAISNIAGYYGRFSAFASSAISSIVGYCGMVISFHSSEISQKTVCSG